MVGVVPFKSCYTCSVGVADVFHIAGSSVAMACYFVDCFTIVGLLSVCQWARIFICFVLSSGM